MLRDVVLFLAGAEFFHTLSHFLLPYFVTFPLQMHVFTLTSTMNIWVIVINGLVTILLLWLAARMKKK